MAFSGQSFPALQFGNHLQQHIEATTMNVPQQRTRRQFQEEARQAHFARIRHVCASNADNLPERDKMLAQCGKLYAEDLAKAEAAYQAQQRSAGGIRR